jgi:acetyl-CoA C-acetyltransferase
MTAPVPVVVGVGQVTHRDDNDPAPAEPLALIATAARAADADAGGGLLAQVDVLDLMPVGSWSYDDLAASVADRLALDVSPARRRVHATGGETPIRVLDAAAARIAAGDARVVLLAGAEGTRAATRARRAGRALPWTPASDRAAIPALGPELAGAFAVGISRALNCFPLYEHALRAHEGRTLDDAQDESARMWAMLAAVAAANPHAWSRTGATAAGVASVGPDNRMVSFPYPKALTANPFVNQGAALLATDTETARTAGVPEDRWVYALGGAGADEPGDPRSRVAYHRVPALEATIREVREVTGIDVGHEEVVELYSCFPAMPKLTRRALGRAGDAPISVTGGLSFFGGPGSNYLTHSVASVVERIRTGGGRGFVHGVGMFNTKHHALVLADHPRDDGRYPAPRYEVGATRPAVESPVPVDEAYTGPGSILTCTVTYARDGTPERGAVIGTGTRGERFAARVDPDGDTLADLTSGSEPVGREGTVVGGDVPWFRF